MERKCRRTMLTRRLELKHLVQNRGVNFDLALSEAEIATIVTQLDLLEPAENKIFRHNFADRQGRLAAIWRVGRYGGAGLQPDPRPSAQPDRHRGDAQFSKIANCLEPDGSRA